MYQGSSAGFGVAGGGTVAELVRAIVDADAAEERARVAQARRLVAWADANVVSAVSDAATAQVEAWAGALDTGVPIAGPGAPLVSDFALQGLCAARGRSFESGRRQVGLVIELAWRLPGIWARVQRFDVALWRALRVAELTRPLAYEAARFVDRHLAHALHGCTWAQIERTVAEAIKRHDPKKAEQDRQEAADQRHFDLDFDAPSNLEHGLVPVTGLLDAADAADLDAAVGRRAAVLGQYGCQAPVEVRRSIAAGELARQDLALDLEVVDETTGEVTRAAKGRQVVLTVHVSEASLRVRDVDRETCVARVDATSSPLGHVPVTTGQVREWCGATGTTTVVIKPVVDLAGHVPVDSYEIPDRLRAQVELRDHVCAYPHCGKPAHRCDLDHHRPHAQGGVTCPCNLVPLCRRHHRLKTHAWGWRYVVVEPGTYLWFSPDRLCWLVDPQGTRLVDSPRSFDDPDPPPTDQQAEPPGRPCNRP